MYGKVGLTCATKWFKDTKQALSTCGPNVNPIFHTFSTCGPHAFQPYTSQSFFEIYNGKILCVENVWRRVWETYGMCHTHFPHELWKMYGAYLPHMWPTYFHIMCPTHKNSLTALSKILMSKTPVLKS